MASINKWLAENKIKSNISPDLDAFGAEDPEDLVDLEDDDVKYLCSKLKKLEAKRFQKALLKLGRPGSNTTISPSAKVQVFKQYQC